MSDEEYLKALSPDISTYKLYLLTRKYKDKSDIANKMFIELEDLKKMHDGCFSEENKILRDLKRHEKKREINRKAVRKFRNKKKEEK